METLTDIMVGFIAWVYLIFTVLLIAFSLIGSLFSIFRFAGVLSAVADYMDEDISDGSTELTENTSDAASLPEESGGLVEGLLAGLFEG